MEERERKKRSGRARLRLGRDCAVKCNGQGELLVRCEIVSFHDHTGRG